MLNLFMNAVADARLAPEAAYCVACIFLISFVLGGSLLTLAVIMKFFEPKKTGRRK